MLRIDHPLLPASLGSARTLTSFHWGQPGSGRKVYIQASLHAEELPGMLVAHHLRALLESAEAADQIQGEIILVRGQSAGAGAARGSQADGPL